MVMISPSDTLYCLPPVAIIAYIWHLLFIITIEKLGVDAGEKVTFDQVLAVSGDDMKVGNPTVAGATVEASVIKEGRAKKVIVYKNKRKTGYHKKNGHRQSFTQVKIEKING